MKVDIIRTNQNINFKENFYKVAKYGKQTSVYVGTDNAEKLGNYPFVTETYGEDIKMVYNGKYYISESPIYSNDYKIKYKDTGKYENHGKKLFFDRDKLISLSQYPDDSHDFILSKGQAQGKLVQAKNLNSKLLKSKEPLIIICENDEECYKYLNRADGIILKSGSIDLLSHFSAICRDTLSCGMLVTDQNVLKNLYNLEGEFISISNKKNIFEYKQIENAIQTKKKNTIKVPQMKKVDKILSLDDCENDTVGNKAYNLKRMKNLVKEGKLQDVFIPNAFVLPHVYLEKVEKLIQEDPKNRWQNNEIAQEINNYAKNIITSPFIMVRSAFNGEDLEGYSAAGLYDSFAQNSDDLNLGVIYDVMKSKNKSIAIKSRKHHNIPDDLIKPSVIIQDGINADYSFTAYTESPFDKNKVLIEMFINEDRFCKPIPYQISYNKLTKELKVEQEHSRYEEYLYDENYKLLDKKLKRPKDIDTILDVIKNLVKNALVLEKEFEKPQDIEGGIKNGQLYFWQTRNIVKKFHQ